MIYVGQPPDCERTGRGLACPASAARASEKERMAVKAMLICRCEDRHSLRCLILRKDHKYHRRHVTDRHFLALLYLNHFLEKPPP